MSHTIPPEYTSADLKQQCGYCRKTFTWSGMVKHLWTCVFEFEDKPLTDEELAACLHLTDPDQENKWALGEPSMHCDWAMWEYRLLSAHGWLPKQRVQGCAFDDTKQNADKEARRYLRAVIYRLAKELAITRAKAKR